MEKVEFSNYDHVLDCYAVINGDRVAIRTNGELRVFLSEDDALDSIPEDEGGRDYEVRRCAVVVSNAGSDYETETK